MDLKNGYKVVYELADNGKRTFYASKENAYPVRDDEGNITDLVLASFEDIDYENRTIYEYKGRFYVTAQGETPKYNEETGEPEDDKLIMDETAFNDVFVEAVESDDEAGENEPEEQEANDETELTDQEVIEDDEQEAGQVETEPSIEDIPEDETVEE